MITIRKIFFVTCGAFILMSSKCAQTKVVLQSSPDFEIINVYTQKMVPGERAKKPYVEFGFEVKGITNKMTLDSVFCEVGQSLEINMDGGKRLKLFVEGQLIDQLKYDKAIFYFTHKDSKHQLVINNILKKETLFLP